jgi:hypothetical protein
MELPGELTPNEEELAHSINPDQMVIEGLADFDPYHGQYQPISVEDEQAIELAIRVLQLRVPEHGAYHWD